jgi:hypothetical protein
MRNNDKTSAIDYGGYRSCFDVILFPTVRSLASHDRHVVSFEGRVLEWRWRRRRAAPTVVELWWQLELSFEGGLAWGCLGEVHPSLYRGVGGVRKL